MQRLSRKNKASAASAAAAAAAAAKHEAAVRSRMIVNTSTMEVVRFIKDLVRSIERFTSDFVPGSTDKVQLELSLDNPPPADPTEAAARDDKIVSTLCVQRTCLRPNRGHPCRTLYIYLTTVRGLVKQCTVRGFCRYPGKGGGGAPEIQTPDTDLVMDEFPFLQECMWAFIVPNMRFFSVLMTAVQNFNSGPAMIKVFDIATGEFSAAGSKKRACLEIATCRHTLQVLLDADDLLAIYMDGKLQEEPADLDELMVASPQPEATYFYENPWTKAEPDLDDKVPDLQPATKALYFKVIAWVSKDIDMSTLQKKPQVVAAECEARRERERMAAEAASHGFGPGGIAG